MSVVARASDGVEAGTGRGGQGRVRTRTGREGGTTGAPRQLVNK